MCVFPTAMTCVMLITWNSMTKLINFSFAQSTERNRPHKERRGKKHIYTKTVPKIYIIRLHPDFACPVKEKAWYVYKSIAVCYVVNIRQV